LKELKGVSVWKQLDQIKKTLIIVLIVSGLVHWASFWLIAKLALNRDITVRIPPGTYQNTAITIGNNKGYMELWGMHFLEVMSEFSPSNYEAKANYLLSYASSKGEKNMRPKFLDGLKEIKETNAYQEFHPKMGSWKTTWLTRELWRIEVEGEAVRETSILNTTTRNKKTRKYYVDIKYSKDGIQLEDFGYVDQ
jgi:hypothetical protein